MAEYMCARGHVSCVTFLHLTFQYCLFNLLISSIPAFILTNILKSNSVFLFIFAEEEIISFYVIFIGGNSQAV